MGDLDDYKRDAMMAERVRAGVKWMDDNAPGGWRGRINLRTFNMEEPCRCVIGQVFGDYWDVLVDFGVVEDERAEEDAQAWEVDHGFNLSDDDSEEEWDALERAWVIALIGGSAPVQWARTRGPRL